MRRENLCLGLVLVWLASVAGEAQQNVSRGTPNYSPLPLDVGLAADQPGLPLVQDGQGVAAIVVSAAALEALATWDEQAADPASEPAKIAWAAHDLQSYIKEISGAVLPIVSEQQPPATGTRILVGRSQATAPFDAQIPQGWTPQRTEEGYAILVEGPVLVLAGNDAGAYHGTEYAVYGFLHRLGVRWYMPSDFGEVVPPRATIAVGPLHVVERPDFKLRNWWTHWFADDLRTSETRWKIRNGMSLSPLHAVPGDSSVRAVLPPESAKDNPEFAEIFARDAAGNVDPHMPNLGSEKSVQYAANIIKENFRKDPQLTSWGIGADDGMPRDYSLATLKMHLNLPSMIGRFNDPAGDDITEEWMQWVQRVAAEVRREFPERFLSTNGYANRDEPALGVLPDPTIWIMFAAIWSDAYHAFDNPNSWMERRHFNMLRTWTAGYDNVYLYDYLYYNLVGCGAPPIPLSRRHARNMPLLKELGVVGFFNEGRTVRGEAGVFPTYLLARMMWDAELDVDACRQEYFSVWYGAAAEPAQAFWDAMERAIESSKIGGNRDHLLSLIYTPELIAELGEHLQRAETAARGDAWAEPHVRADRATYEYLLEFKAVERAEAAADWNAAVAHIDAMVAAIRPAMEISRFYWDISSEAKPVAGQAHGFYYWGTGHRQQVYRELAAKTGGAEGTLVAVLPEQAKFRTDPRDDGRFDRWFRPDWEDDDWNVLATTKPFFADERYMDANGFPYLGAVWYRLNVDVPADADQRPVHLYALNVETEAWVWVNGRFVGHRPYQEAYLRPNPLDLDVTAALQPGVQNSVVLRLHTNYQPAQMAGGLVARLFLYSPKNPAN